MRDPAPNKKLERRWTRVGEHRIYTRLAEEPVVDSPPIVLVHGYVMSSRYLVPTAERLAPFHAVYAPDLPGFGKSSKPRRVLSVPEMADVLAAWMEVSGLSRAVLVGNSMGCQVIADLAARYPDRVERAVLTSPSFASGARSPGIEAWRLLLDLPRESFSLLPIGFRDYARAGLFRAWRTLRYGLADPIEERLPLLQTPTLVVRGSRDPIVSQHWAEEVTRLLPDGRLAVIPGGPHALNYSRAPALVALIREFLAEG
jgi:pimeloyl-ACP methyl ester carboxylesterase